MEWFEQFVELSFFANTGLDWSRALLIFIGTTLVLKLFQLFILKKLGVLAQKTKTEFDDVVIEIFTDIKAPLYAMVSLWASAKVLTLPDALTRAIDIAFVVVVVWEVIRGVEKLVNYFAENYLNSAKKANKDEKKHSETLVNMIKVLARIFLWLLGLTFILSFLGVNITSIVASLGIGGIAIALAVQNILGDIFSSFSIYIDKPFEIGDYIVVGKDKGVVEKIGLKSTRLRSLQGEELVISNKELTSVRIQNYKTMKKRRVTLTLSIVYGTSHKNLKSLPKHLKDVVRSVAKTQWYNGYFARFNESSIDYDLIFYVTSGDYLDYMKTLEKVNLAIYKMFSDQGIEFAYPTRTIIQDDHLHSHAIQSRSKAKIKK